MTAKSNSGAESQPWGPCSPAGLWTITSARRPAGACAAGEETYGGTVEITANGDAWICEWTTDLGSFKGSGVIHNGRFLAGRDVSKRPGVFWYTLLSDDTIAAGWNSPHSGLDGRGLGTGRATGGESDSILGSRQIHYFDALGGQVGNELTVTIEALDGALGLRWCRGPNREFEGVGIRTDYGLAAFFVENKTDCEGTLPKGPGMFLSFEAVSPDEAYGTSAALGCGDLGYERIQRKASRAERPGRDRERSRSNLRR